jgi:hypothetical protein
MLRYRWQKMNVATTILEQIFCFVNREKEKGDHNPPKLPKGGPQRTGTMCSARGLRGVAPTTFQNLSERNNSKHDPKHDNKPDRADDDAGPGEQTVEVPGIAHYLFYEGIEGVKIFIHGNIPPDLSTPRNILQNVIGNFYRFVRILFHCLKKLDIFAKCWLGRTWWDARGQKSTGIPRLICIIHKCILGLL